MYYGESATSDSGLFQFLREEDDWDISAGYESAAYSSSRLRTTFRFRTFGGIASTAATSVGGSCGQNEAESASEEVSYFVG